MTHDRSLVRALGAALLILTAGVAAVLAEPLPCTIWSRTYPISLSWPWPDNFVTYTVSDNQGNIYMTTNQQEDLGKTQTMKFNSLGVLQWTVTTTSASHYEFGTGIALDPISGYVYVTGMLPQTSKYRTIKYDLNGTLIWDKDTLGGYGNGVGSNAITVGGSKAHLFIADPNGTGGLSEYDADGVFQRHVTVSANCSAVDTSGNIYTAGIDMPGGNYFNTSYVTAKYNASGTLLWSVLFKNAGTIHYPTGIAVDAGGGVYMTGYEERNGFVECARTIKYSASGSELWNVRVNVSQNCGIVLNGSGDVYVVGRDNDLYILKYDPSGGLRATFRTGLVDMIYGTGIVLGRNGEVYGAGLSMEGGCVVGTEKLAVVQFAQCPALPAGSVSKIYHARFDPTKKETCLIEYAASAGKVLIVVYDLQGRKVRKVLEAEAVGDATGCVRWDGRDEWGDVVSSGLYIVQIQAGGTTETRKVVVVK